MSTDRAEQAKRGASSTTCGSLPKFGHLISIPAMMHATTVSIFREDSDDEQVEVEVTFYAPDEFEVSEETTTGQMLTKHELNEATWKAPEAIADWYQSQAESRADGRDGR